MILAAFLMLQAVPDAATVDPRLLAWRGTVKDGVCKTRTSTGDAALDRVGCTAMEHCTPQFDSRFAGTQDRAIRPEVKKVMIAALNAELARCVESERKAGIAALATKRQGA